MSIRERYAAERKKHPRMPARMAIRNARYEAPTGEDLYGVASSMVDSGLYDASDTWHVSGFDFEARVSVDECPDLSYLGEYTDTWEPGAIDRFHGKDNPYARVYRYFVPSTDRGTFEEHRTALRAMGYGKHEADTAARKIVREDFERAEAYNEHEWGMLVVTVTASRAGIELASDSIGGIESDYDAGALFDTLGDLEHEALTQARAAMAALCETRKGA